MSEVDIFPPTTGGKEFPKPEIKPSMGELIRIIDLGTHMTTGEYAKPTRMIRFIWEINQEYQYEDQDGKTVTKPHTIMRWFNFTLGPKSALRKAIQEWTGKNDIGSGGLARFIGSKALLNLEENGDFINIKSYMPIPEGMGSFNAVSEKYIFSIDQWDQKVFEMMGKKTQEKILASHEITSGEAAMPDMSGIPTDTPDAFSEKEDSIPF